MKKDTAIRTVLLIFALINQFFMILGRPVIPLGEESLTELISVGFTTVCALAAWWKNNSFSPEAMEADKYLEELKSRR